VVEQDLWALTQRTRAVGATIESVLHHTDKAIVAAGRHAERPVILKLLTTDDPYWVRRHHEHDGLAYQR
jgi:hypothetical protein